MHTFSNLLLTAVAMLESSQSCALSLPKRRSWDARAFSSDSVSSACTTNITIPTVSENCISSCRLFREAQLRCSDYSLCMCKFASSIDLQSCMSCIIEGTGHFGHVFQEYIDTSNIQVVNYAAVCNATRSYPLPASDLATTHPERNNSPGLFDNCSHRDTAMIPILTTLLRPDNRPAGLVFLLLTLVTSLILLLLVCFYPCSWKEFGIL